ncbi:MAG: phytanoyl-CoA dioxygenase family protein [Verrucomicrobia bacterium]|nr:phytanoyl-CoA dioxygenase family protein [Verrucomicrobiota bacterium]
MVPWHQDLSLALRACANVPGFGPCSTKDGIPQVQPPVDLLQQMLAVRLHFDDANESNGALRVLPGSHRLGRLSAERIQQLRAECPEFLGKVSAGDALLMRAWLLHASSRSTRAEHRRVLHIEHAAFTLPENRTGMMQLDPIRRTPNQDAGNENKTRDVALHERANRLSAVRSIVAGVGLARARSLGPSAQFLSRLLKPLKCERNVRPNSTTGGVAGH